MSFRQFVINNVRRNPKVYGPYFFTSFFAVTMFFVYALLVFHPEFKNNIDSSSTTMSYFAMIGFQVSQVIIVVFSAFAIFYAVSTFLKTRKAEFGLLLIQGINKKQLVKLIFWENMLAGLAAVVCGVIFGFIFSKVILLICSKILALTETLPFYFPWKPILLTFGVFGLMFLVISLVTSFTIRVNNLKALLASQKEPKKEIKASWYIALLALVLIGTGYSVVLLFTNLESFALTPLFTGVILVVIGTYFFFSQLLVFVLTRLRKRESFFFKRTNLLTFSELIYQMRDNVSTFFIVAIVSATAITAMGTSSAIGSSGLAEMSENPYAITYKAYGQDEVSKDIISYTEKTLHNDSYKRADGYFYQFSDDADVFYSFMSINDYNALMGLRDEAEIKIPTGTVVLLPTDSLSETKLKKDAPKKFELQFSNKTITLPVEKVAPINRFPYGSGSNGMPNVTLLANQADIDMLWQESEARYKNAEDNYNAKIPYSIFHTDDWENTTTTAKKLSDYINIWNDKNQNINKGIYTGFESLALQWQSMQQVNGLLLLLTVLCGAVFYTFSAGFIYLRLHSDLKRDEQQYKMLFKIGLTKPELHKIVARQLRVMFFLPLFVAVIHSLVAFLALQNLLDFNIWKNVGIVIGIFIVVQAVYYFFVKHQYLKQLRRIMK
ncbi:FtsX-like permease family protein [Listeria grandensis]|uniref:FtsX-like permease family protein n=1 Tax=Listeria grandensis TaxID=1494963 RepID=UPI00164D28F9|nr:FtsX-like permease family protein [Listeria grandensis]MBC6314906.1 FtsX-like permease family protein [Listeria grandensis]